jgi:hypothetical protein
MTCGILDQPNLIHACSKPQVVTVLFYWAHVSPIVGKKIKFKNEKLLPYLLGHSTLLAKY